MSITVYGIPNCGTVKKARAWLEARGLDHDFVDFRETPATEAQITRWVAQFGAKAMRNTSGGSYRALGEEKKTWSEEAWRDAFAADPMLIKRPIIERDGHPAKVGFRGSDEDIAAALSVE